MKICNAGIYAIRKEVLERYFLVMANRPQVVHKKIDGNMTPIEEYFLTDLVEVMVLDGRLVGYVLCEEEGEAMGVDNPIALEMAQSYFAKAWAFCG